MTSSLSFVSNLLGSVLERMELQLEMQLGVQLLGVDVAETLGAFGNVIPPSEEHALILGHAGGKHVLRALAHCRPRVVDGLSWVFRRDLQIRTEEASSKGGWFFVGPR